MNSIQFRFVARFALVLLIVCCPEMPVRGQSQVPDSDSVRQQFREFYQPRLPALRSSYSTVRFRCAFTTLMGDSVQVRYARGTFQNTHFVFDRFAATWIRRSEFSRAAVIRQYSDEGVAEQSGGSLAGYSFVVDYRKQRAMLSVLHDESLNTMEFSPLVIAPICSVSLLRTYQSIMDDQQVTFVEFIDRRTQSGKRVKTLFYRPAGSPKSLINEADFDPQTGVCLSSLEFDIQYPDDPMKVTVEYDTPTDNLLPPPSIISVNKTFADNVYVIQFDRVTELRRNELSVVAFGFDESETVRNQTAVEKIASSATRLLMVAGLVIASLFLFFAILMFLISLFAKRAGNRTPASDSAPSDDLSP